MKIPLIKDYIGNSTGDCKFKASINTEETTTSKFEISNKINLDIKLDKEKYNPGEIATLSLTAVKKNKKVLKGFGKINGIIKTTKEITDGKFVEKFQIPETIESGEYTLEIFVYDELEGKILNSENKTISFKVNQVPTFIQISLANDKAIPGKDFKISTEIIDQAGVKMDGLITLTILSPENNEKILKVKSGDSIKLNLPFNSTAGTWRILPSYEKLLSEKNFEVLEIQKININLEGSLLTIKNIGNVKYNKSIDVRIGEKIKTLKLNINKGETRKFNLNAPNGEYTVKIKSGEKAIEKNILLTGNAISINDSEGINIFSKFPLIWIFLILIISAAGIIFFRKGGKASKLKQKKILKLFNKKKKTTIKPNGKIEKPKIKTTGAESTLVLSGEKSQASIISLKISNMKTLGKNAKKELLEILKSAKEAKGMIERKDDYLMIIFSPLTTKTFHNEILAVKTGKKLFDSLKEYNKKFKDKIEFNIGINSGEIISTLEEGKLKYTSLKNTIILSRKISDVSKGKILISDNLKNKIPREVKIEKSSTIGKNVIYELIEVKDRAANNEKLKSILKRMGKE